MIFPQTALQTDAPGCHLEANVTTLSMVTKTKSKATPLREPKPSAEDLVSEPVNFQFNLIKKNFFEDKMKIGLYSLFCV